MRRLQCRKHRHYQARGNRKKLIEGEADTNKSASPFVFEKVVYKWLDTALDYGMSEGTFWNSTIAELVRAIESKKRQQRTEAQQQAVFDYILAETVGRSVARIHSSSNRMPQLYEVYPSLFDSEEAEQQRQAKKDELSALRFKQFAMSFNSKYKGESKDK